MHVQSCCFANVNRLLFLPFSLPSPTLLLKRPIVVIQNVATMLLLPHAQLKKQLHDLLERVFNTKGKASSTNNFRTFWANDETSTRYTYFSRRELGLLTFLSIISTFVLEAWFSGRLLVYPWAPTVHLCWLISSFIPLRTILWSKQ